MFRPKPGTQPNGKKQKETERMKYISLCELYDYIIEILKVIGHPRIGQMPWDSIRYVVARNSRLWLCYMP